MTRSVSALLKFVKQYPADRESEDDGHEFLLAFGDDGKLAAARWPLVYRDARLIRSRNQSRFPRAVEDDVARHIVGSYELATLPGSHRARIAGLANEIQGLLW